MPHRHSGLWELLETKMSCNHSTQTVLAAAVGGAVVGAGAAYLFNSTSTTTDPTRIAKDRCKEFLDAQVHIPDKKISFAARIVTSPLGGRAWEAYGGERLHVFRWGEGLQGEHTPPRPCLLSRYHSTLTHAMIALLHQRIDSLSDPPPQ